MAIRALLVLNPSSRSGSEADLDSGIASLRSTGMQVDLLHSGGPQETDAEIRRRREALDLVIVGGGDGTVSSVARTLYECRLPLAILPLGTANDLARSLGIKDLQQAFAVIRANHRRSIDLGSVNDNLFFNVAHMGLGVSVTQALDDEAKKRWGVFSYLRAFFSAVARTRQFRVQITAEGDRYAQRSIQLAVGNGRYYGGGNVVHESARIDNARLCLYSLRPQGVWELLTLAPLLRGGRHDLARRVFTLSGRQIEIVTRPAGMEIHADGEPTTRTPATFKVLPGALEVVVPRDAPELADKETESP